MIRFARSSLLAAVTAGLLFPAAVGVAAYPNAGYAGPTNSQLTLVSATEDQPQTADPSSVRLADPHAVAAPAEQPSVQAAPKPAAPQPAARPAATSVSKSRPTTAAPQPAPRTSATAPRPAVKPTPRQPTPNYYPPRGGVQLAAQVSVEPSRQPTAMRPVPPPVATPLPAPAPTESPAPPPSPEVEASVGESGNCASCPTCPTCCDSCRGFCAGMEYLFVRPHFNDDEAFQQMTATTTTTTSTVVNQLINFDEPYNSDYHFFLGYRTACGDEFRFGFWHIADDGNRTGTATGDFLAGAGVAFQAPGGTDLTAAGETVTATTHMYLNMYDLEDVKRVDLPNFGCNCCPEWEVHWSYGLRVVDFRHTEDDLSPFETINNEASFTGAGPKLGLEVRRQIGHSKVWAYVSASGAMLLGEQRGRSTVSTPGVFMTAVDTSEASAIRKIPDVNISVGLTWKPSCCTTFTAGWMFEDFGDLGAATCIGCNTPTGTLSSGDLSFDGLFVRAEHCF